MDTTTESRGLGCTALRVALGTSLPAAQQAVVVVVTVCRRRRRVCRSRVCRPRAAPYDLSCKRLIAGMNALHGDAETPRGAFERSPMRARHELPLPSCASPRRLLRHFTTGALFDLPRKVRPRA